LFSKICTRAPIARCLSTLFPHHAEYVTCSHFDLYVSILFATYADSEISFPSFPSQLQNCLSADVVLGGNVVLINKSVLLFSL